MNLLIAEVEKSMMRPEQLLSVCLMYTNVQSMICAYSKHSTVAKQK